MNSEIDQLRRSAELVVLPGNLAGPSPRHAIVALGVLFLAQVSGCASVRTRIAGGPFAVVTARALGTYSKYVTVWDERQAPDGSWHWRASSGHGHEYLCTLAKGAKTAQCGGYYFDNGLDPLQD